MVVNFLKYAVVTLKSSWSDKWDKFHMMIRTMNGKESIFYIINLDTNLRPSAI